MSHPLGTESEADRVSAFFFELSPDPVLVFRQGVITHANPAAVELLRAASASELIGRASRDIIDARSFPIVENNVRAIEGGVRVTRSEETYIRLDGTPVDVEVSAARATFYEGRAFVVILRDMTDRKEIALRREREEAARSRERWLGEVFDGLPIAVFAHDDEGRLLLVNRACATFVGQHARDLVGRAAGEAVAAHVPIFGRDAKDMSLLEDGAPITLPEVEMTDGRGRRRVLQTTKVRVSFDGRPLILGVVSDLTEERSLQQQLLQSQKMESLGRLAGGIAHDFNNLLTVIIECADHLSEAIPDRLEDLASIREASTRAASLTRRLLAFARQAPSRPRAVVFDEVLRHTARLLGRVLGEDIILTTDFGASGEYVSIEPEQFELVLINLAVNARDAMPQGGSLTIRTRKVEDRVDGRWVELSVIDTGIGMDEATRSRALEPFFTTKGEGVGTGLGLSTCLGIVEQSGGELTLESKPGGGTTVRIGLPIRQRPSLTVAATTPPRASRAEPRTATVLMVEDDAHVRRATHRMLRSLGYAVLSAAGPSEALVLAQQHPGPIDLLLTDVVMPGMNGVETARAFRAFRPSAPVVFVSGHPRNAFAEETPDVANYLSKPFSRNELASVLSEVLEAHSAHSSGLPDA